MTDFKARLPEWAHYRGDNQHGVPIVDVLTHEAYEAMLRELRVSDPDQYWLEVAYQCIKLDVQVAMRRPTFEIRMHDPDKRWAQAKYPKGRGAEVASRGLEAREHYRRLRGFFPS